MARGPASHVMPPPSVRAGGGGMEQTVTIINNSGKIVNTGKQLVSLFKEVSNSYKDKKAELKLRRFIQRSASDQPAPDVPRTREFEPHAAANRSDDAYYRQGDDAAAATAEYRLEDGRRTRHAYDEQSVASSRRSYRSRQSSTRSDQHRRRSTGQGLTENNLDRLSEASGTAPSSRGLGTYRSPYAETIQPGAATTTRNNGTEYERSIAPSECTQAASESLRMQGGLALNQRQQIQPQYIAEEEGSESSDDDMHLAYGSLPPDLEQRRDLDPVGGPVDNVEEVAQAESLIHKIEDLLDEVECMEHTATEMIKHLQERPDAAAAVALTLAELSAFVGKLSPGFLSVLKGGSPAVFALLASPQFLIGTGIAVGVTVVMFGGWKIIQRATGQLEQQQQQQQGRQALAFEANPAPAPAPGSAQPASQMANDEAEEALVLKRMEEELSGIESWRRGIVADSSWEKESAEMELITPKAKTRRIWGRDKTSSSNKANINKLSSHDDDDTKSRMSSRTHKSTRSSASHKQKPSSSSLPSSHVREEHHSHHHQHASADPGRKSSGRRGDESASVASSGTSRRSSSTKKPREHHGEDHRSSNSARGGSGKVVEAPPPPPAGGKTKEKTSTSTMIKNLFKSKDKERQGEPVSAS